jgi:hypothetical protein
MNVGEHKMPQTDPRWNGIAPACFLSVFCALAVSKHPTPNEGIVAWLLFVITSGLFIDANQYKSKWEQLVFTLLPTLALILTWLLIPFLGVIMGGRYNDYRGLFSSFEILMPILLVVTPPFLFLASYFRETLFNAFNRPESDFKRWLSITKLIFLIGTAVILGLRFLF